MGHLSEGRLQGKSKGASQSASISLREKFQALHEPVPQPDARSAEARTVAILDASYERYDRLRRLLDQNRWDALRNPRTGRNRYLGIVAPEDPSASGSAPRPAGPRTRKRRFPRSDFQAADGLVPGVSMSQLTRLRDERNRIAHRPAPHDGRTFFVDQVWELLEQVADALW